MGLSGSNWSLHRFLSCFPPPPLLLFPQFLIIVDTRNGVVDIYGQRPQVDKERKDSLASERPTGRCSSSGSSLLKLYNLVEH